MVSLSEDSNFNFGEIIDKSLFEDEMVAIAKKLHDKKMSVYDLQSTTDAMSHEKDKYVMINIYKMHASIVVVDKELFKTLLFEPIFGQLIDGRNIFMRQDSETYRRMATSIPLQQYHICLDETNSKYMLTRNMYYFNWLMKSRSFFVGESAMCYLYFQLLALQVVPSRYRLLESDCLEFAKRFAMEVAVRENGIRASEVRVLYTTLRVSEQYFIENLEQSSRNNPTSAFSVAVSYFMSFKPERIVISGICVLVVTIAFRMARQLKSE
ncbi:uncharacterized protein LOC110250235 [Exaiptasia diaphana]|uniref:Uncharacterized protein n=1 Tax=Exaiptasia diaphana TaxID=2652724 RepID=A0A913XZV9_EXADI|nr:uncharacterized protein LOC110250235 [Exaiptasia diaphana]